MIVIVLHLYGITMSVFKTISRLLTAPLAQGGQEVLLPPDSTPVSVNYDKGRTVLTLWEAVVQGKGSICTSEEEEQPLRCYASAVWLQRFDHVARVCCSKTPGSGKKTTSICNNKIYGHQSCCNGPVKMARYLRPPNTSLFVRNIADESRYVLFLTPLAVCVHGQANGMLVMVIGKHLTPP